MRYLDYARWFSKMMNSGPGPRFTGISLEEPRFHVRIHTEDQEVDCTVNDEQFELLFPQLFQFAGGRHNPNWSFDYRSSDGYFMVVRKV